MITHKKRSSCACNILFKYCGRVGSCSDEETDRWQHESCTWTTSTILAVHGRIPQKLVEIGMLQCSSNFVLCSEMSSGVCVLRSASNIVNAAHRSYSLRQTMHTGHEVFISSHPWLQIKHIERHDTYVTERYINKISSVYKIIKQTSAGENSLPRSFK